MSETTHKWTGTDGEETWWLEIEHDCMKDGDPLTVTLWLQYEADGETHDGLVVATPDEAREMAAALTRHAEYADEANARALQRKTD